MASGQRRYTAGLLEARQPVLKGSDVHPVEAGDLRLSALMIQVGRNGSPTSLLCCNAHTETLNHLYGFSTVKCSN